MKIKKNKITFLTLGILLSTSLVSGVVVSCASNFLSVSQQRKMEIDPIFVGYDSYNFSDVLAKSFLKNINEIIKFKNNNEAVYKYIKSEINPTDENAIDVYLEYEYKNNKYRYKKTYQNFSSAAIERKRVENQNYLDSESNKSAVEILPTYDKNKYKIPETTASEAIKWPTSAFTFNSSNKELKFNVINIVDNGNNSVNLNIRVELGENKSYASKIYHKVITGFLPQLERDKQVANQAAIDNEQNQLAPTLKNESTKQATRSSVIENFKNLFNLPSKEGFSYEFVDAKLKEDSKTAILIRIQISKGENSNFVNKIYTKEIDGFAPDK